nr:auxilin-like protein [Tanacetum cinerariifolium]
MLKFKVDVHVWVVQGFILWSYSAASGVAILVIVPLDSSIRLLGMILYGYYLLCHMEIIVADCKVRLFGAVRHTVLVTSYIRLSLCLGSFTRKTIDVAVIVTYVVTLLVTLEVAYELIVNTLYGELSIAKLFFGLRTCQHVHMEEAALFFEKVLRIFEFFGEHTVHCKELPGFKYRHDMVKGVIFYICRRAGISAKKEERVNFSIDSSDGRTTLRQTDILVFGSVRGKYVCVDLNEVSPLVGLSSKGFTVGHATLKIALCKVKKHAKACMKTQHMFIPFAFNASGFLAPEALEIVSRVQRIMNSNVMTYRSTNGVLEKLDLKSKKT